MTVRAATVRDLPDVVALERACYSDPWSPTSFATLPDNDRVFFVVARDTADRLMGFAIAWYVMDEGELANLAVAETARRRGLARALLESVLADARGRGVANLFLEVREANTAARALYSASHFEEIGRRKHYYSAPVEDALILRHTIKPQL